MKPRSSNRKVDVEKLAIARKVVDLLRRKLGKQFIAAGVCGSVARGTAERYSDIDLIVLVNNLPVALPRHRIVDGTYCSINYITRKRALSELSHASDEFPQVLGGYRRILPIQDPSGLLKRLEERSVSIPDELFTESAKLALLHSYEDLCRAKNAFLNGDDIVLKDSIFIVTNSAANIVASLNHAAFASDREIFKAHKNFPKVPRDFHRIEKLRYGSLPPPRLFRMLHAFYLDLIEFSRREGIDFPVGERTLRKLR